MGHEFGLPSNSHRRPSAHGVRRNLEVKALDLAPHHSLSTARRLGAEDCGQFFQRDTFFAVTHGRLKLREQFSGAQLIQYLRPDTAAARVSRYRVAPVSNPEECNAILGESIGVACVVEKERQLLKLGNVRVHLDKVCGLGSFIELEAVIPHGADSDDEATKVATLQREFGIRDELLIACSYADALGEAASRAA